MDETSRRKRRRSIRNLRRQSVILGIGSDDPVALSCESTDEKHEEEFGSIWLDGEPSTKHKTRTVSRFNSFANKISLDGPDWSPVEFARSPSASLSPKVMTPFNLFTQMKSLEEASVTINDYKNNNLDMAFIDDTISISPNDSIVHHPFLTHPSPCESLLNEEKPILSQTNKYSSSPLYMNSPTMQNISCSSRPSVYETSNGITPPSGVHQFVSDSIVFDTPLGESANKETYYTGLIVEQSEPDQDGQKITDKHDSVIGDFINSPDLSEHVHHQVVRNLPQDSGHTGDGRGVVRNSPNGSGHVDCGAVVRCLPQHVGESAVVARNTPVQLRYVCESQDVRKSPEQFVHVGERRKKISSSNTEDECRKSVDLTKHVEAQLSGATELVEQSSSNFVNMEVINKGILKDRNTLNSNDEAFYTPNTTKSPNRFNSKRLASGAVHFIRNITSKLSKEKKNRRKTIFLFQDVSAPSVESPKELPSLPVGSVERTLNYCTHSCKENNCPGLLCNSVDETICESFHSADAKPVSVDRSSDVGINSTYSSNLLMNDAIESETETTDFGTHIEILPSMVKITDVHVGAQPEEHLSSPCMVRGSDFSDYIETLPSVSKATESDFGAQLEERLCSPCATADSNSDDHPECLKTTHTSSKRTKRRSSDFTLVSEYNTSQNLKTENVSSSSTCRRSRRRSYEMCRRQNGVKSDAEAADLMEINTVETEPEKPKKVTRYRKKNEKDLEDLYRNKNFKMPTKKNWETIYEVPHNKMLVSRKKLNRTIVFESVPLAKQRQRLKKAAKLGWDITGMKRLKIPDDYVENMINAIALDLASTDF